MATDHSAGAQALGYLYQVWYALYLILEYDKPNLAVRIEGLDDIDILNEDMLQDLLQGKHHLDRQETLPDRSPDLWRTIRIWSEHVKEMRIFPHETTLTLFTTAQASKNSIAALLRPNLHTRNPQLACQKLREQTKKPTKQLQKGFDAFMNLSADQQEELVGAIQVLDMGPTIPELMTKIENRLIGVHPNDRVEVRESLEGRWWNQIVRHLYEGSVEPIKKSFVESQVVLLNQKYKPLLPNNYRLEEDFDPTDPEWQNERFVRQLTAIDAAREAKELAISERMRAYGQRTRWQEELRIEPERIEQYEEELVQEWQYARLDLNEDFGESLDDSNESQLKKYGRELYKNVRKHNIQISHEFTMAYMMRGSYHLLADKNTPRVWWHPKFPEHDERET